MSKIIIRKTDNGHAYENPNSERGVWTIMRLFRKLSNKYLHQIVGQLMRVERCKKQKRGSTDDEDLKSENETAQISVNSSLKINFLFLLIILLSII